MSTGSIFVEDFFMIRNNTFVNNSVQFGQSVDIRWPRLRSALDLVYNLVDNVMPTTIPKRMKENEGAQSGILESPSTIRDGISSKDR
jgi:hypothetical protein